MLKRIRNILFLVLASAVLRAEVCVVPVFPFGKEVPTAMVLAELQKKNIHATVCSNQPQQTEIYFYPLRVTSNQLNFQTTIQATTFGAVANTSTYKSHWDTSIWVVSIHPWGEEVSTKRVIGYSLKSQIGKIAKDLRRSK